MGIGGCDAWSTSLRRHAELFSVSALKLYSNEILKRVQDDGALFWVYGMGIGGCDALLYISAPSC